MDYGDIEELEMFEEEEFEDMDEDDPEEVVESDRESRRIHKRNLETIRTFLGEGKQEQVSIIRPRYYGDLLAWALKRCIENDGWKIVKVFGHRAEATEYTEVNTDYGKSENALCNGYLLLNKADIRLVASIKTQRLCAANAVITGTRKKAVKGFAKDVSELAQGKNLYQGKNIELGGSIAFLKLPVKGWDDLALEPAMKEEIQTNTVGFLNRSEEMAKYGIPLRRGVILAGEPGTGKTLISKIIMNQSSGITCISAQANSLAYPGYIYELYGLAKDLKPSIVFLEDIDLIGEDRRRMKGSALPTLLAKLDGIEECHEVVTIASTNFLENIDDALRKRPSRFDRIIQLTLPSLEQRRDFTRYLSQKIPMAEDVQEYLACRTDNLTPAQIQEVAYSLVIKHKHSPQCGELGCCQFSKGDVDRVLALVKVDRRGREMGFIRAGNNGGGSLGLERTRVLNSESKSETNRKGGDKDVR
jgi:cell division protease FtsH